MSNGLIFENLSADPRDAVDPRPRSLAATQSPELQTALTYLDKAKKDLDASHAKLMGAGVPMKKWTVRMKDGMEYHGVLAPDAKTAMEKMTKGPQGPMAPKPVPTPYQRPAPGGASMVGLPELGKTALLATGGPALGAAGLAAEAVSPAKTPTTGREIAGSLVPLAVGAAVPPGRTISRFLGTLGGNILGRAGVEAGAEAIHPTGRGPLQAGVRGAAQGVLPGAVQAAVGSIFGPNRDTINMQKALRSLKTGVSPEVAALIKPEDPASALSRKTARGMQRAAGSNLDKMEAEVEKALGPEWRFKGSAQPTGGVSTASGRSIPGGIPPELLARATGQPVGQTFSEVRAQIKKLREIGDASYADPAAKAALKKNAATLEAQLASQMPPAIAKRYQQAIERHAKDSEAIRWVKQVQKENQNRGGSSPADRPEIAAADRALNRKGPGRALVHGTLGAAEALTGRPIGAGYQLGRVADTTRGGGPLRPSGRGTSVVPRISGALAGTGTAAAQSRVKREDEE